MSSKHSSGGLPPTPDDILNDYLDDLLGTGDLLELALESMDAGIVQEASFAGAGSFAGGVSAAPSGISAAVADGSTASLPVAPPPATPKTGSSRVISLPLKTAGGKSPWVNHSSQSSTAEATTPIAGPQLVPQVVEPRPEAVIDLEDEQKKKLERLLQSARTQLLEETPVEVPVKTITETKTAFVENPEEIQDWTIDTAEITPEPVAAVVVEEEPQISRFQMAGLEWHENGRPQWAQSRFDVLLFQVAGLTLAVPLIALGQIQPITDELTPLFGQAEWFMGLQPTPAGKIRTVNTARFVMPERYDVSFLQTAKYVVSIDGVPWGLAVDSVNQPITLQPEDVKWRGDRSKRPWLAGTVKGHMCALLDIPRIGQMLIEADKNFVSV